MRTALCFAMLVLAMAAFALSSPAARASGTPLNICNKSSDRLNIAIGYHSPGPDDTNSMLTGPFVSRGWFILEPGRCQSYANPFSARYMFWTGFKTGALLFDSGTAYFCVPNLTSRPPRFEFEDENDSQSACTSAPPADTYGPDEWIAARKVDVAVDPNDEYDGTP